MGRRGVMWVLGVGMGQVVALGNRQAGDQRGDVRQ